MSTFPEEPGWRRQAEGETSRDAALSVFDTARPMMRVLEDLLADGPASPEQLTERLSGMMGRRVLLTSVRARVCQLHKLGRVKDSGGRDVGESGRVKVIRWRLTTPEERATFEAARAMPGPADGIE